MLFAKTNNLIFTILTVFNALCFMSQRQLVFTDVFFMFFKKKPVGQC
jgi:hypothetical protein